MTGAKVLFAAGDRAHGYELWVTDGSSAGTYLVEDINPGPSNSDPAEITSLGDGSALFSATNGATGYELWVTNGSSDGTSFLNDIYPGGIGSSPQYITALGDGEAVFSANDGADGTELWVSDGTSAGTSLLKDIDPGKGGSSPTDITAFGHGEALFGANNGSNGIELWVTDGTSAGTSIVTDINPGTAASNPMNITAFGNGSALFSASDGTHGYELWVTDGTAAGTSLVKDIHPGTGSSYPSHITPLGNGNAVFQANDGSDGAELWVTNGTAAGTFLLRDIHPGSGSSYPHDITALGDGEALFSANDGSAGYELWVTNGTPSGTSLVRDIDPGSAGSNPGDITALGNGKALFSANDGTNGTQLWVSDGTSAGTYMVDAINPAGNSNPTDITAVGAGLALFKATDDGSHYQLWVTDGTSAHTSLVQGTAPPVIASNPSDLTLLGAAPGRTLVWTGGADTDFANASNWDDTSSGPDPALVAPGPRDTVLFIDRGGTVTGTGTVASVEVGATGSGVLELTGGAVLAAGSLDVGVVTTDVGKIVVTGAGTDLTTDGSVIVGDQGTGVLSVLGGATAAAASFLVASGTASSGALDVTGAGSNLQITGALTVGAAGFGQLSAAQGGTVSAASLDEGAASGGAGAISVAGTDSAIDLSGLATIGDFAPATLSLLNGGTFQAGFVNVGTGASTGAITVGGTQTDFNIANDMTVGHNGVFSIGVGVTVFIAGNFDEIGAVNQGDGSLIDPATVVNTGPHGGGGGSGITAATSITNNSTYAAGGQFNGAYVLTTKLLTGTGVLEIDPVVNPGSVGDLVLNAATVTATQTVVFGGADAVLTLGTNGVADAISGFHATINGFVAGDTIVVTTSAAADFTLSGSVISVTDKVGGATEGTLAFADATAAGVALIQLRCFAAGTLIETPDGPRRVETLAVGDAVVTVLGGAGRIVWVGARTVDCARHPRPETVWPVRIARGAFGANVPVRDLYVSPDHAIYVDGVLVPARLLVNGTTIRQVERRHVVYHHIELARHDVVLAEGLPVESYLDTGDRVGLSEGAEAVRLFQHDMARPGSDTARIWEISGVAPLVLTGSNLAAARCVGTSTGSIGDQRRIPANHR